MKTRANIVIIGAGIAGASAAFHLSKMGAKNIIILDAHTSGGLYSPASAAMLMHQTGIKETTELAKFSIQKYANFSEEVGKEINFRRTGSALFTTKQDGIKKLQEYISIQNSLGIHTEECNGEKIQKYSHELISSKDIIFGSYCPLDAYIDATEVIKAYLDRAIELGVKLNENSKVTSILNGNGSVRGVELENGSIVETGIIIDCAGGFSKDLGQMVEIDIPIKNSKRD